jgi:hypothetical protein
MNEKRPSRGENGILLRGEDLDEIPNVAIVHAGFVVD